MPPDHPASSDQIHVDQLEVFARIGVTDNERAAPQRLTFSVTVWPRIPFHQSEDDINRTVDYSAIAVAVRDFARGRQFKLIESLAANLAAHLLKVFPIERVQIELRKFVLPEAHHVSVMLIRTAAA